MTTKRMFCDGCDDVMSKTHRTAYIYGWNAAVAGKPRSSCQYKRSAGGVGYMRAWESGWIDGQKEAKRLA